MACVSKIRPPAPTPRVDSLRPVISLAARPLWRENLAWLELASLWSERGQLRKSRAHSPKSVLLIPGFMTGDRHMAMMNNWLLRTGHATDCAGIRFNVDCSEASVSRIEQRLSQFAAARRQRVVLVATVAEVCLRESSQSDVQTSSRAS
jgi:hypothetical protein